MRKTFILAGLLVMLLAPAMAQAAPGTVLNHTGLRAGPGKKYPLIAKLETGSPIDVLGCVTGWDWCEVVAGGVHGWAVGHRLGIGFAGQNVQVGIYGPRLGLPVVVFQEQPYWRQYYYNRDFYLQRYGRGAPPPVMVQQRTTVVTTVHHDTPHHHHDEMDRPENHGYQSDSAYHVNYNWGH
jgi:uncharacterized protein YraI